MKDKNIPQQCRELDGDKPKKPIRIEQFIPYSETQVEANIKRWAVGLITAPRETPTLLRCVRSIQKAGWPCPHVFAEPNTPIPRELSSTKLPIIQRWARLKPWANWMLGMRELFFWYPKAEAYIMCEDDALFADVPGDTVRAYLERSLWPADDVGFISLFALSRTHRPGVTGWLKNSPRRRWGGAVALVFPAATVHALINLPRVVGGLRRGMYGMDQRFSRWAKRAGRGVYFTQPSLVQHIGDTSTITEGIGIRSASQFLGDVLLADE